MEKKKTMAIIIIAAVSGSVGITFLFVHTVFSEELDPIFLPAARHQNQAPTISGLPNQTILEDGQIPNAFDLDDYAVDPDTIILAYAIIGNTAPNCGVSIDGENRIDVEPLSQRHARSRS